jgi:predicted DNA-binding antitoxin AbrB/MazE fold protein
MQAIKAIYDGVHFKPKQPIPVSGQYEVVITFVEQISTNLPVNPHDQINIDLNFWKEFDRLVADASDEVLSLDDFPRTKFTRPLIVIDDEV